MNRPLLTILAGFAISVGPVLAQVTSVQPPATAPATAPATVPAGGPVARPPIPPIVGGPGLAVGGDMLANMKRNVEASKTRIEALPEGGSCKLEDLLRLTISDGQLICEPGSFTPAQPGQCRVKVEGSDATWVVTNNGFGAAGRNLGPVAIAGKGGVFNLQRYDWNAADRDGFWMINVNSFNGVSLGAQKLTSSVNFSQHDGNIMLNVFEFGKINRNNGLRAESLVQLQADHPEEVRNLLVPLLRNLTGKNLLHTPPADLYAVFTEIPADPAVTGKVVALLPRLDADDFTVRDSASKDLARLGIPGILAAMRMETDKLSAEQKARLDGFIADEGRVSIKDPLSARKNLNFLLDALNDADVAIVAAAKHALEELVGHPVKLEGQPGTDQYNASLDSLHIQFKKEMDAKNPPHVEPEATPNPTARPLPPLHVMPLPVPLPPAQQ